VASEGSSTTSTTFSWTAGQWASLLYNSPNSTLKSYAQAQCMGSHLMVLVPTQAQFTALPPSEKDFVMRSLWEYCPSWKF
jgi:hypothetical protein